MVEILTKRFGAKNLDCTSCAAKIEQGLKAVDGINDALIIARADVGVAMGALGS